MAIMFVRAQVIGRGAGRSIVSAAAYRHRTRMTDEQVGTSFTYRGGLSDLVHEELVLPNATPAWLRKAIDGRSVAGASEVLWNAVDAFEKRADAQLARELIIALPEELTRTENIALVREFVRDNLTLKGMVADWVYHDKDGNPHIHLLTTLRPLTDEGFGSKKVAVTGADGEPLRVVTPDRPKGRIVYRIWAGDKETMKAWKIGWADAANRHLALAGHEILLDGRSYAEQGLDGIAQKHLGPEKAALARKGREMFFAPVELARRQEMADRLLADPELLLKQLADERSTFDERDIARALHRYVDDPVDFANIRARLMASNDLVTLKPQLFDPQTGKAADPAIFTMRDSLRIEYDMAQSARVLAERGGHAVPDRRITEAIGSVEMRDPQRRFRLDAEQVDAVRHVTGDSALAAVVGFAGTGKSTLLDAARVGWASEGRRVIGAALAGKAAEGLEDSSGIKSRTLASWELAWADGRDKLGRGDVLVIDEAGMVSSKQMARVLKIVEEAGAKVVLVGDAMQLQPIQAGAAFRAITERIGFAELSGVRRQSEQWARDASRLFARRDVEQGLDAYVERGHLVEAETREEAIGRIVSDWTDARRELLQKSVNEGSLGRLRGDELLVLTHTNVDVKRLNEALRTVMTAEGALGDSHAFQTERGAREFASGDRIIFLKNARFFEPRAEHPDAQYVKNGMLGTVVSTTDKRGRILLSVHLDNGRDVIFGEDSYRNVDHGYAATIHKSQGATVDRTFVLATGMMDQHLTYVSMTRHRHRADLYAAKEDFEAKPQWGGMSRVDHAAGITGELIGVGGAQFREGKDVDPSPYADIKTDDGVTHRLWGVSLPKALRESGVDVGDTVTLRKDGVEKVKVQVPIIDEETGRKRFEVREVDRNVWTARQVEAAVARWKRIEQESHRPALFNQLVERLSRSGAKTTTLDFEDEAGYQAFASDFARRRGISHLAEMAAGIEDYVARQLARLAGMRKELAVLWERANVALGFAIERERHIAYDDRVQAPSVEQTSVEDMRYLLAPVTSFSRGVDEDARLAQLASRGCQEREAILRAQLGKIFVESGQALALLNERASRADAMPHRLADAITRAPATLGRLRGSDRLVDGRTARDERNSANAALAELKSLVHAHTAAFRKNSERFAARERTRRTHMSFSVPALSMAAHARLSEIEAIRQAGGQEAYKAAFLFAAEDRSIVQEIKAVSQALTVRFGRSAFTDKANEHVERTAMERMPEDLGQEKREELVKLFTAVKRFAEAQHQAERQDRSRIVAAVAFDPERQKTAAPPLLAAVTEFKAPVEEDAKATAMSTPHYQQRRAALAEAAISIWRDPAGAVTTIEALITKGIVADRIAAAVAGDPGAYGALRGSDRVIDWLLASGRERRDALQVLPEVATRLTALASAYSNAFDTALRTLRQERRRMGIAIPGLSRGARDDLVRLTLAVTKNPRAFAGLIRALDPKVRDEFAAVSKALDARFGTGAIGRDEKDVLNTVPPADRKAFDAMRTSLKVLQRAVRIESSQKILAERQAHAIGRGRDLHQ
ncbi:Ti-type conjugative transfer relaxase TraA [Rhizobium mongolense]|uniref:Ti-type conjugative transfer relaxase TraA n=1 Tax=Rhizobium mongolense TaxID=57676 RepID=A0A7W6RTL1_9HYPH|nr:Ti-type conjugative transfer relaxase TraA [Rhizobium mongolense]MBB4277846.1 Ti-type conjugative transfer relaxase TraA [Rhizobium mongolense]